MADLSETRRLPDVVREAEEALGPIDILVNNARIIRCRDAPDSTNEDRGAVPTTNLKSPFFLAQAVARSMTASARRGKIINVNAVVPGCFATGNREALRRDTVRNAQILSRTPAGRRGEPSDLAGAVIFPVSGASDSVRGAGPPVDGGWLAR